MCICVGVVKAVDVEIEEPVATVVDLFLHGVHIEGSIITPSCHVGCDR